jgi:biopolymer transport protein ExbB/TolQ
MEDRILNLEIKMTTMHNPLMKIANKVQYWEEQEETERTGDWEKMDTETGAEKEEIHTISNSQENQPRQPRQTNSQDPLDQSKRDNEIQERQERLENNMEEMMGILGKIASKIDKQDKTSQKPGQERGPINQQQ